MGRVQHRSPIQTIVTRESLRLGDSLMEAHTQPWTHDERSRVIHLHANLHLTNARRKLMKHHEHEQPVKVPSKLYESNIEVEYMPLNRDKRLLKQHGNSARNAEALGTLIRPEQWCIYGARIEFLVIPRCFPGLGSAFSEMYAFSWTA